MENIEELEKRAEIELEKLGVAEDLGWGVASFAACAAYLKWESWWLATAIVIGGYFLVTYPYRKRESTASDAFQDAYHRASGTGKYNRLTDIHDA